MFKKMDKNRFAKICTKFNKILEDNLRNIKIGR